ncbi:hypothetical protein [Actinopolyspora mortivallis]|uniref:hypothetical protein n=1 Tax=Actinopolyspora mortivallis TaxID=33906 RepID=UPI0003693814|nr:hypothetical protein [Actinopolyspora mortivallis]
MTGTDPATRTSPLRVAAGLLLVGTVLYVLPTALHGNPPVGSASAMLEYVHQRPSWRITHLTNILAVLLWACAFSVATPVLASTTTGLTRALRVVFTASTAVFAVYFSVHAFGLTVAADQYFASGADQAAVLERTETVLILLGSIAFTAQAMLGISIALAGLTLARTMTPRWLGWSAVVAGTGWLTGALLMNFAVIVPFTVLVWLWTALLAVRMWRLSGGSPHRAVTG